MNKAEYDSLIKKINQQFELAIAPAKQERDAKLSALDTVWRIANEAPAPHVVEKMNTTVIGSGTDRWAVHPQGRTLVALEPSPTRVAKEVIQEIREPFSVAELVPAIESKMQRPVNRTTVSSIINKLATESKEIILVKQGGGRYPAYYRRRMESDPPELMSEVKLESEQNQTLTAQ